MADILQEMLHIEEEARLIVNSAQKQADDMSVRARRQAETLLSETKTKARQEAESIVRCAIENALKDKEAQIAVLNDKYRPIETRAEQDLPQAVQDIVQRLAFNPPLEK